MTATQTPAGAREGEAQVPAGQKCQWAACHKPAAGFDEWWHCAEHLVLHRTIDAPDKPSPKPGANKLAPCGTIAAYSRHTRRKEVCEECCLANTARTRSARAALIAKLPLDEQAIFAAMDGRRVRLTAPERLEAVRRMRLRGVSTTEIGKRLRISGTTTKRLLEQVAA